MSELQTRELFRLQATVPPPQRTLHYLHHPLDVPAGCSELELTLSFDKVVDVLQLYAVLLDPRGEFRGHVQCPGGPGPRRQILRVGASRERTTPGCLAGPIPEGRWTIRIDLDRHKISAPYALTVTGTLGPSTGAAMPKVAPRPVHLGGEGWYRGELHSHSHHSDGKTDTHALVASAREQGLQFLAVTDHFTHSHWSELAAQGGDDLLLLQSIELTSHQGHANLHGLTEWVDVYVDRPERSVNDVIRDVHRQGGLFCVNHAFSGDQAWKRFDTDWSQVDLMEVWHLQQFSNNDANLGLWDRMLAAGHRIVGIGGSDCHNPADPKQRFGQVVTHVFAKEGTRDGILAGLRSGQVTVGLGAQVRLSVEDDAGARVPMGATAKLARGDVRLHAEIQSDGPAVAFLIRDGLLLSYQPVTGQPGWQTLQFEDGLADGRTSYYRLEVHAPPGNDPKFWATCLRDHKSLRAFGNPVWVTR
ncbi:MAG: CehA/McbA family metallohydrolase [Myxococcaceae bacterium]|nr:CehA/McbA family metallohydrolase [Myxococcaceae bacterium]